MVRETGQRPNARRATRHEHGGAVRRQDPEPAKICFGHSNNMISRYTRPEMAQIWTDESKFQTMLQIEILACESLARQGKVPHSDIKLIKKRAKINIKEIDEIGPPLAYGHDLI